MQRHLHFLAENRGRRGHATQAEEDMRQEIGLCLRLVPGLAVKESASPLAGSFPGTYLLSVLRACQMHPRASEPFAFSGFPGVRLFPFHKVSAPILCFQRGLLPPSKNVLEKDCRIGRSHKPHRSFKSLQQPG